MDTYFDTHTRDFWHRVRDRVTPLIGDLSKVLGEDTWVETTSKLFTTADFLAVHGATSAGGTPVHWHEIRLAGDEFPLDAWRSFDGDPVTCARSPHGGLAWLAQRCNVSGFWPDEITRDGQSILLFRKGRPFARVQPIRRASIPEADRRRAIGTLVGLRKFESPTQEFQKRLRRWPGLESITLNENDRSRGHFVAHLPVPAEWLLSAQLMCERAGIQQPSMQLKQRVAAAVLGAASWNHIASNPDAQQGSSFSAWTIGANGEQDESFPDPFSAFAALARRAPLWSKDVSTLRANPFASSLSRCAAFVFEDAAPPPKPGSFEVNFPDTLDAYPTQRVQLEGEEDLNLARACAAALRNHSLDALKQIFRVGASATERLTMLELDRSELHIASEGRYRFTRDAKYFWVREHDDDGSIVRQAAAELYKAALFTHPSGMWVLTSEYDLKEPEFVLPSLSERTRLAVDAALQESPEHRAALRFRAEIYPWKGTVADHAIAEAAEALARGGAVDLAALPLHLTEREVSILHVHEDGSTETEIRPITRPGN